MARGRKRTRRKQSERRRLSEQYRLEADVLALEGDIEAAREGYERAASIDETNAEALVGLGDTYVFSEMPAEAYRAYKQALSVHPRHGPAHASLAEFLARHGYLKQAIRAQERAVECDPKRSYFHYRLAMLYQRAGNLDRAEERLQHAIGLDEREALYHYKLGELRARRGQWAAALGCYRAATDCSPLDEFYYVRLAAGGLEQRAARRYQQRLGRQRPRLAAQPLESAGAGTEHKQRTANQQQGHHRLHVSSLHSNSFTRR